MRTSDAATTVDELLIRPKIRDRPRRPNEIEVTETNPKRIARILDNLAKRSNTEFQDKALRILYIAAGFLDWHDAQREKAISSPLVLVPVELRRESTRDPYRLFFVDDEEIVINPSLTEKLRRDAGLDIPGDWAWEDKPISAELDEIRQAVDGTGWTRARGGRDRPVQLPEVRHVPRPSRSRGPRRGPPDRAVARSRPAARRAPRG